MLKKILLLAGAPILVLALVFLSSVNNAHAAPGGCVASSSGLWSNPSTWTGSCLGTGGIPDSTHSAVVNSGAVVTVDIDAEAGSLVVNNAGATTGITISGTNSLTVIGGISLNAPSADGTTTLDVGAGTLNTSAASLNIYGGTGAKISQITVSTGTIEASNINFSGTATNSRLISTGASTINISVNISSNGTLTTNGTGTINFNGSSAEVIGSYTTYNNIVISNTSGSVTLDGPVIIGGTLSVNTGTLESGLYNLTVQGATTVASGGTLLFSGNADQTFNGDVTLDSGSTWNETATPAIYFGGNFTSDSTDFTANTGPHIFTGTDKTITTIDDTIPYFVVNGTLTNNGNIKGGNDLSGSGTFINSADATLKIDDAITITGLDVTAPGNIVTYSGGSQTVRSENYSILLLKGSGTKTITTGLDMHYFSVKSGVVADLTGTSTTQILFLNNINQVTGTWGATGSGATNINDTYFTGTGMVSVTGPTTTETIDSISADTGTSSTDFVTKTAAQTIYATLSTPLFSGEVLYGSVDAGGSYGDITSMVSGTAVTWTGATLTDGTSSITMKVLYDVTDGPVASHTYTLDTTAPSNQDTVFPTSTSKSSGATVTIVSSSDATNEVWFAPSGTTTFVAGATMTKATSGTATTILAPATNGTYKLFVIDLAGNISTASTATLTVSNTTLTTSTSTTTILIPSIISVSPNNGGGSNNIQINGCLGNNTVSTITGQKCSSISTSGEKSTEPQFIRTLKFGSYGDDVKHLQQFLNSHGAQITVNGNGSPGKEIKVFGSKTVAALARYQKANNIYPSIGFFGPITVKFVNAIIIGK